MMSAPPRTSVLRVRIARREIRDQRLAASGAERREAFLDAVHACFDSPDKDGRQMGWTFTTA
jgi:hypothetical protein